MSGPVVRSPLDLRWESVFEGAEMAALYGDPTEPGALFIVRFRTDRLIEVPLHWHRTDEHITVLHRPFSVRFADEKYTQLEEESYVLIPAGVQHASRYGPGTVIQVSGVGPLESIYADPASHPGGYSVAT